MSAPITTPWPEPPAEGEATEVAEDILWMRLPLPMKLDHVNVYALADDDGWTLVDTGFSTRRSRAIWEALLAGPLKGRPVRRVLVTHHHPDHIGLAGWFQREHGAELVTTRTAWLMARMLCLDVQETPTPEQVTFWRRGGMDPALLEQRRHERPFNTADVVHPLPLGYTRLRQGVTFCAAGRVWDVHTGFGHAPEHATLWSRDDKMVLAGDQVISSISPNIGIHATEPEADPLAGWLESCERLAMLARDDHLVLSGHKLPFTGLPRRMAQLLDNHHGALARLLAYLDTPKAAGECFAPLFRRRIGPGEYGLALAEAMAHLVHLHRAGKVRRALRDDGAWTYQRKDVP